MSRCCCDGVHAAEGCLHSLSQKLQECFESVQRGSANSLQLAEMPSQRFSHGGYKQPMPATSHSCGSQDTRASHSTASRSSKHAILGLPLSMLTCTSGLLSTAMSASSLTLVSFFLLSISHTHTLSLSLSLSLLSPLTKEILLCYQYSTNMYLQSLGPPKMPPILPNNPLTMFSYA